MRSTRASYQITSKKASQEPSFEGRLLLVTVLFSLLAVIILGRLFQLQVVEGKT
mgnify:FL=1